MILAKSLHIIRTHLPHHLTGKGDTFTQVVHIVGDMRVVRTLLPDPTLVRADALHHGVWRTQVLVVAHAIVIGTGSFQGKTRDKRQVPCQGGIDRRRCALVLLVTGLINGGQRAHQVALVVLHGARIIPIVFFRKIRMHLHGLAGNGEPAHLRVAAVGTAGKEGRRVAVANHAGQAHLIVQVLGQGALNIGTDIIPGITELVDITFLVHDTGAHKEAGFVVTALNRYVVLLGKPRPEHLLHIIHIVPAVRTGPHGSNVLLGEIRHILLCRGDFPVGKLVHHLRYIIIIRKLGAVHELREVGIHAGTHGTVVGDTGVALVAFLGSDDNHAAGGLEAIDGGRSTVLQYGDALDIGRVNVVDIVHRETVHHVGHAVNGATDAQGCLVQARFTGFLHGGDTGELTGQHLRNVGGRSLQEFIALDGAHGGRQGFLLGRTVTYHHYIFQIKRIFLQGDIQVLLSLVIALLGSQTQAGELQDVPLVHLQGIRSVGGCHGAVGGSFHQHRDACQGLAVRIGHLAADLCLGKGYALQQDEACHQGSHKTGKDFHSVY